MSGMDGLEATELVEAMVTTVLYEDKRSRDELAVGLPCDVKIVAHAAAEIIAGLLDNIARQRNLDVLELWRRQQLAITQGRLEGRAL